MGKLKGAGCGVLTEMLINSQEAIITEIINWAPIGSKTWNLPISLVFRTRICTYYWLLRLKILRAPPASR